MMTGVPVAGVLGWRSERRGAVRVGGHLAAPVAGWVLVSREFVIPDALLVKQPVHAPAERGLEDVQYALDELELLLQELLELLLLELLLLELLLLELELAELRRMPGGADGKVPKGVRGGLALGAHGLFLS